MSGLCECLSVNARGCEEKTEAGGRLGRGAREDNQTQRKTETEMEGVGKGGWRAFR